MTFNVYSIWTDPVFYVAATVLALALFFLVYSIRRYLEIKNESDVFSEPGQEETNPDLGQVDMFDVEEAAPAAAQATEPQPEQEPVRAPASVHDVSRAEEFVKGLYDHLAGIDARLKDIEVLFSKSKVNTEFTVKFLEDMIADIDTLDKDKIKVRIEYLLSDLKK